MARCRDLIQSRASWNETFAIYDVLRFGWVLRVKRGLADSRGASMIESEIHSPILSSIRSSAELRLPLYFCVLTYAARSARSP